MANTSETKPTKSRAFTGLAWFVFFIGILMVFGRISLRLGKDINWDVKNYHYYNAYAFIEHRQDIDIEPAQLQTFFNPILDLPFYWMAQHFPARVAGFVLGFVHGLNFVLIFLIFWNISSYSNQRWKFICGICIASMAVIAPGFISEIGNTMNDNLTSLFVLGALLLLILAPTSLNQGKTRRGLLLIGSAGLLLGLGVGLKPTVGIFAIASALALTFSLSSWQNKITALATYGITGLTGALVSAGFWWWHLFTRYGNPLLPFYNNIFKSPYIAPLVFTDTRFLPRQIWEYFVWPLVFTWNALRVNEAIFFDIRFALLYLLLLSWLVVSVVKKFRSAGQQKTDQGPSLIFERKSGNFLLIFFCIAFVLWMVQFSIYRYIIPLELLLPLCFLIILERMIRSRNLQIAIALSASVTS